MKHLFCDNKRTECMYYLPLYQVYYISLHFDVAKLIINFNWWHSMPVCSWLVALNYFSNTTKINLISTLSYLLCVGNIKLYMFILLPKPEESGRT